MTPTSDAPRSNQRGPSEFEGRKGDIQEAITRHRAGDHKVAAGQLLLREGEPWKAVLYLGQGWLLFSKETDGGRRRILQFGLPGTLTGSLTGTAAYGVQALSDVVVSLVPYAHFEALAHDNPPLGLRVAGLVARHPSFGFEHMPDRSQYSARERVAQLILELFIRMRVEPPSHATGMMLPLGSEHVADATGFTHAETDQLLHELESDGIAERREGGINIVNPDGLVDASGVDLKVMRSFLFP